MSGQGGSRQWGGTETGEAPPWALARSGSGSAVSPDPAPRIRYCCSWTRSRKTFRKRRRANAAPHNGQDDPQDHPDPGPGNLVEPRSLRPSGRRSSPRSCRSDRAARRQPVRSVARDPAALAYRDRSAVSDGPSIGDRFHDFLRRSRRCLTGRTFRQGGQSGHHGGRRRRSLLGALGQQGHDQVRQRRRQGGLQRCRGFGCGRGHGDQDGHRGAASWKARCPVVIS